MPKSIMAAAAQRANIEASLAAKGFKPPQLPPPYEEDGDDDDYEEVVEVREEPAALNLQRR